ncbi:hypothetical protein, partial [Klebsiella grimontii]
MDVIDIYSPSGGNAPVWVPVVAPGCNGVSPSAAKSWQEKAREEVKAKVRDSVLIFILIVHFMTSAGTIKIKKGTIRNSINKN